ncbi:hypothetical protein HZI73_09850 [Vallitalea pronyensis]|uniref:Uncharacterized protein n=1 Tax=Vallitalea pronyensis TaxID=1348613 RepID=A0A8J8SGB1_9FIRM|nr:hypothetical protein [Vallitalea pronyensis]QUI22585.1 hypothetical protein HZI73_09850 [Vallitalea pronyensis]
MLEEQIHVKSKRKLLIRLIIIFLILFIIKPIKWMNFSNINKIVITNEAEKQQNPLILNDDDLIQFKELAGHYTFLTIRPFGGYKLLVNLRIDFYKNNNKKYSMYLYSSNDGIESYILLPYHIHGYNLPKKVIEALETIIKTYNFSLDTF